MSKKKKKLSAETIQTEHTNPTKAGACNRSGFTPLVKTCVLFAIILLALHAFTWAFALKGWVNWGYGTAHAVSSILNSIGIKNTVNNNVIFLRNDTWEVTSDCTAVNAICLFIAFILAYSSTYKSKAIGLISGIPLIMAVNIIRLVVLGWVTEFWPTQAEMFHDYVWQTLFLFFIIALWFIWINKVVSHEKTINLSA